MESELSTIDTKHRGRRNQGIDEECISGGEEAGGRGIINELSTKRLGCSPHSEALISDSNPSSPWISSQLPSPLDSKRSNGQVPRMEIEGGDCDDSTNNAKEDVAKIKGNEIMQQESDPFILAAQDAGVDSVDVATSGESDPLTIEQAKLRTRPHFIIAVEDEEAVEGLKVMRFRRKSSMKVRTLQESLHSCDSTAPSTVVRSDTGSNMFNNVSFHTVEIREYERSISDNPSCTNGASVGLGWEVTNTQILGLDEFEDSLSKDRDMRSWFLSRIQREDILKECGLSKRDIANATRTNIQAKHKRRQTINNLKVCRIEEAFESLGRKMRRLLLRRGKSYEMDCLYEQQAKRASIMIKEENDAAKKDAEEIALKQSNDM